MFNDGIQSRMLLKGQMINKPGRRFKYTDGDFLEAYWGKDGMSNQTMMALQEEEYAHNMQPFDYNRSLKEMFPMREEYKRLPKIKAEQAKLDEHFGFKQLDGETFSPEAAAFLENFYYNRYDDHTFAAEELRSMDRPHPYDRTRSYLPDLQKRIEQVRAQKAKDPEWDGSLDLQTYTNVLRRLDREYTDYSGRGAGSPLRKE